MSKTDIYNNIANNLTSNSWKSLKTSLIGKELLSFGTEAVYQVQQLLVSMTNPLFIDFADSAALKAAAFVNDCVVPNIIPSYIKIKITLATNVVIKPFDLKLIVGGVTFTNIDFVNTANAIILYQGTVCSVASYSLASLGSLVDLAYDQVNTWTEYSQFTTSSVYSKYVKLSSSVMPSSVRVFASPITAGVAFPFTEFDFNLASSVANLYKVRNGRDDIINVWFGNGVWGTQLSSDYYYQIYWLDLGITAFNVSSASNITWSGNSIQIYDSSESQVQYFTILSSYQGSSADQDYQRTQLKAQLASRVAISSKTQIEDFVNSYDSVLDCNAINSGDNVVTVYVKPKDEDDTYFQDIEDALALKGELQTSFIIQAATAFLFDIVLSSESSSLTEALKTQIISLLTSKYDYADLAYNATVTSKAINEAISTLIPFEVQVALDITEKLGSGTSLTLKLQPYKGSIKIYDDAGDLFGWDSDGYILTKSTELAMFKPTIGLGDTLIDFVNMYCYDTVYNCMSSITNALSILKGCTQFLVSSDYILFYNNGKYYIYSYNAVFTSGDYSLMKLNNTYRSPLYTISSNDLSTFPSSNRSIFYNNSVYVLTSKTDAKPIITNIYSVASKTQAVAGTIYFDKLHGNYYQVAETLVQVNANAVPMGTSFTGRSFTALYTVTDDTAIGKVLFNNSAVVGSTVLVYQQLYGYYWSCEVLSSGDITCTAIATRLTSGYYSLTINNVTTYYQFSIALNLTNTLSTDSITNVAEVVTDNSVINDDSLVTYLENQNVLTDGATVVVSYGGLVYVALISLVETKETYPDNSIYYYYLLKYDMVQVSDGSFEFEQNKGYGISLLKNIASTDGYIKLIRSGSDLLLISSTTSLLTIVKNFEYSPVVYNGISVAITGVGSSDVLTLLESITNIVDDPYHNKLFITTTVVNSSGFYKTYELDYPVIYNEYSAIKFVNGLTELDSLTNVGSFDNMFINNGSAFVSIGSRVFYIKSLVCTEITFIPYITEIGSIDYLSKALFLNSEAVKGMTCKYETINASIISGDAYYPKLNSVSWE